MVGRAFTLLVCLSLASSVYAQSFSLSYSNISSVGQSQDVTLTLTGFNESSSSVQVIISFDSSSVVSCANPVLTFFNDQSLSTTLQGVGVGVVSISFTSSDSGYSVPSPQSVYVFLNVFLDGNKSLYPGKTVQGTVSLDASPSQSVTATLSSDPAITLTPSTFTFKAGESPFSQLYTITSTLPGEYAILLTLTGSDVSQGYVSSTTTNITLQVDFRLVYGRVPSPSYLSLSVGEASGTILIYVDVSPESNVGVGVFSSDPSVVATPSALTLSAGHLSTTFTVSGSVAGSYSINFTLGGTDKVKYALDISTIPITITNRTIYVPSSIPALVVGTPSTPLTAYITAPPTSTLILTPWGQNLTFSPPNITFTPSSLVVPFTVTASGDTASSIVSYAISGADATRYSIPASSSITIVASLRYINPVFSASLGSFPVGVSVAASLTLDYPTPSSFTVQLVGAGLLFNPSSFTFLNGSGTLQQSFSVNSTSLGSTRIYFNIAGVDAALVAPVESLAVTVIPRSSPVLTFPLDIFVGVTTLGNIALPFPVTSGLTVALSTIPIGVATFSPATFTLTPSSSSFDFTVVSSSVGPLRVHAVIGGADALFYGSVSDVDVNSNPIEISVSYTSTSLVVGLTYGGIVVSLGQPTALPVTVTPQSKLFQFSPPTLSFGGTSVACFSITPTSATTQGSVIVFTVDDATNFNPPDPLPVSPIDLRTISIDSSALNNGLVVGIASAPIIVTLSVVPTTQLILTPASPLLIFKPSSLTFTQDSASLSFSITATSMDAQGGTITWAVSGTDANLYVSPPLTYGTTVGQRSIFVPSNIDTGLVGQSSKPFLITTDYAPSVSLIVTPSAPGLLFFPASVLLLPGAAFASFTAVLQSWKPLNNDPSIQNFVVRYTVTGPDAGWYALNYAYTTYSVRQLELYVTPPTSLQYDIPSGLYAITLEQPPKVSLQILLCASAAISMVPTTLTFGPSDYTLQFSLLANSALLYEPVPSNLAVSWQLAGQSESFYVAPDPFTLSLSLSNTIIVAGLPSEFSIATSTAFEVALPDLNHEFTSVTLTFAASALTFTPAQVTFVPNRLRFFVSVAADVVLKVPDDSFYDEVVFLLSGPDALRFTAPAASPVSIDKQAIVVSYPELSTVGTYLTGAISLFQPPATSLTLTAVVSPGITMSPNIFTFGSSDTSAYFLIFATTTAPVWLEWELSGPDASYYSVPFGVAYSDLSLRTVSVFPGLLEVSPDGTTSSEIRVTLSDSPVNGLIVSPVLPPGFQSTRSLHFGPGQAGLNLQLSVNSSADTFYSGYFQIAFEMSGPDSDWYTLTDALMVTILQGQFYMELSPTTVGYPSYNEITLTVAPPNGVTLIPSATGVIFDPPQLEFNQSTLVGKINITPLFVGTIYISWRVEGPDAWIYQVPVTVGFTSTSRLLYVVFDELDTLLVGVPYLGTAYISDPPPTGVTISLLAPCLSINPGSAISFTPTTATVQFTYTAYVTCDEAGFVYGTVTGPDAGWYDQPFSDNIAFYARRRNLAITGSFELVSGIASPLLVNLEIPGDITLFPAAPGCTFNPSELVFSDSVSSIQMTVLCESTASYSNLVSVTLAIEVLGDDADLYDVGEYGVDIYSNSLWIPNGPIEILSGQPYTYSVSLSYLPSSPITLTPYGTAFTFNPPSITFTDSLYETFTVVSTTPSGFPLYIYYNISGVGISGVSLTSQYTEFFALSGTIYETIDDYELAVGALSEELTLLVDPPPQNGLTVVITAAGCTFSPSTLSFTSSTPTALFKFWCSNPGTSWARFVVSGPDAIHYTIPDPTELFISQRNVIPSVQTDVIVFQTNYGFVSLDAPTERGLTITPSAPGFTFAPSSFIMEQGSSVFSFTYTATQVTGSRTSPVTWSLSGSDAAWYGVPSSPIDVFVFYKQVLVLDDYSAYAQSALLVGTPTKVFVATVDYPPESQLIVTPIGAGLTFSPSSLVFGKGVTGVPFTIQASVDGIDMPIYYNLSGWDAPYYFVHPLNSYITTELLQLVLNYNDDVTVGVPSDTAVISATNFPSAPVILQFSGSGVTYSSPLVSLGPTTSTAVFEFTSQFVGSGAIVVSVSGAGASQFSDKYWIFEFTSNPRQFLVPASVPDLFAGIPSSLLSIGVEQPPPSTVILTPHAPNVVFYPPSLTFTALVRHVEFNATSVLPAAQNQLYSDFNFPHFITWEVDGENADWYSPPSSLGFYALPRDLTVTSPFLQQVYINVPVLLYFTSTYEPTENLTIIPSGAFTFNPAVITLLPGTRSASLEVIPRVQGSYDIQFTLLGADAPLYQAVQLVNLVVQKWHFEIPSFSQTFQYDNWNAPLVIRPHIVPPTGVTLTLSSTYLDFYPSTLTFSNSAPYANVSLYLKGLGYSRSQDFTITFWVGGVDASLFYTPNPVSFSWDANPTRSVTISNFPDRLVVGIESAPILVAIPNFPVDELIITPFATTFGVVFTPPSIQLSRTSTSLTASFTISINHPLPFVEVNFALDGNDALYYLPGPTYQILVALSIPSPTQIRLASQPLAISLPYPTPQRVTLSFSSPSIAFDPYIVTFTPNQSSVPFILTGGTVGDTVPLSVWVGGEDADWYAVSQPAPIQINSRQWKSTPEEVSVIPGKPTTVFFSVFVPPNSYITLTPYASGISFYPPIANMSSSTSSVSFTLWGEVGGTSATVTTTIGGPDALLYDNVENYQAQINFLTVTATQGLNDDENTIQLGETNTVVFGVSAPSRNGLYVTPSAQGLVFDPPMLYFAPGVLYAHATYTASTPGITQVTFALSGPDRLLYQIDPDLSALVSVELLTLNIGEIEALLVGSVSSTNAILSVGSNGRQLPPPLAISVNFIISPPEAVTVFPANVTLSAPASSFAVQFQPNIFAEMLVVQPIISGPGAMFYTDPEPIIITSARRDFIISSFSNFVVDPATAQFTVGVEVGPFGVTARSVPSYVELFLSGPGLKFIPSVLRFTGTYETLYFTIIPIQPIQTYVSFAVGGADAQLFEVPPVSPQIRVTHNFILPPLPAVIVGQSSSSLTVSVASQLTSPVILEPTADCVTFSPPYLIFTPNVSQQTFTFAGTCVNYNLGENVNPVVTQSSHLRYSNPPSITPVVWQVREAGELDWYELSVPQLRGTQAANIVPATFKVNFSKLYIGGTQGFVNISVTAPPRSDVVLTLIANNLNFDPPYATFTYATTNQILSIQVVHSDFKDSQNIPFVVDYIVSGYNWADYIPPAQTYLGVQQGAAPVVGAICGNGSSLQVNIVVILVAALLSLLYY